MKKRLLRAAAALLALSMLAGCTLTEQIGESGEENGGAEEQIAARSPGYFGLAYYASEKVNPVTSASRINRILTEGLYEGLFTLDSKFTPQPVLCESYAGDGTTWTFTLKSGVTFWSGNPLTAADVVFSYQTAMKTETSPYYSRMQQIQSVSAPSENTMQIVLKSPNTQLPALLDVPVFRKGSEENAFADGTGPYMPQSDNTVRWLVPYASWHGGALTEFERIELVSTVRADAVVYSFETGDISLTRADRISASPATFKGTAEVYQTATTDLHYLGINYGRAPYHVGAVRQAISAAFDRARLCATQLQSFADPAVLPVNPQPKTSEALQYSLEQDGEKALSLLASVGISDTNGDGVLDYPTADGKRAPLAPVILVNSDNTFKVAVATQLVADLEKIGIRASVNAVPFDEFQTALASSQYDLYYGETILSADFDLRPLMSVGGAVNKSGYASQTTESLLARSRAATGDSLVAAQTELYNHLLIAMPIIPLAFTRGQVITRSGLVKNFTPAPFNVFYGATNWKAE